MSLEESLQFDPLGGLKGQQGDAAASSSSRMNPIRPAKTGLQLCAVPTDTIGLAYLCTPSCELQALQFDAQSKDPDESPVVMFRISLPALPLHCSTSADGRLVAVACGDGSLRCFDVVSDKFMERWNLSNAHSHRMSSWDATVSTSRAFGAAASMLLSTKMEYKEKDCKLLRLPSSPHRQYCPRR